MIVVDFGGIVADVAIAVHRAPWFLRISVEPGQWCHWPRCERG